MNKKITVREVAIENPEIKLHNYKWNDDEKDAVFLSDVLGELGYRIKHEEDYEQQRDYNDIKAYYNVEVEAI